MNQKSPQASNEAFMANRTIPVPGIRCQACVVAIQASLGKLEGIRKLEIDLQRKQVRIVYDATQLGFEAVEKTLVNAGYPLTDNWWTRFKSGWYRYSDDTDRANAKSTDVACCGNPSDIYAKRHK